MNVDSAFNQLVFPVDTLMAVGIYTLAATTLTYIDVAGATKTDNYGTINFAKRTNFDWILDISTNMLTNTCKGVISLVNCNFNSILTFKLKNVFFVLGTEKGQTFLGAYSPYDGSLLDAFNDTTNTAFNFTSTTGISLQTDLKNGYFQPVGKEVYV